MKKIGYPLMLGFVLQVFSVTQSLGQGSPANTNTPAAKVAPTVIARSANSRIWARITSQTNAAGQVSSVTNKAYTELASGLCYLKDGEWVDANPTIAIVEDGAAATQTQHTVHFAGNANKAGGAIHLVAPDGKVFDSRVYGLAYWDSASGKSVLLAPLQDCQGTLVGTNRIIYTNAFNGVNADLEYVLTKGGLEQNVILREKIPSPGSLGEGLADTSRLQVLTEFFTPPAPKKKKSMVISGVAEDTSVNFGAMGIGIGKAFSIPGEHGTNAAKLGRVSKHWMQLDGRDFLIEEVPYKAISNAVQKLPDHASAGGVGAAVKHIAALEPLLPREVASTSPPVAMKLALGMPEAAGVVVDYTEFDYADISTNLVFQNDTTYYINGSLVLSQTPVFEGGTVLKFESSYSGTALQNESDSLCAFNGSDYLPVVCTSSGDDSVGETIAGSGGGGGAEYIYECGGGGGATGVTVANVRFSYAGNAAYEDDNDTSHIFRDCQFVQIANDAVYLPNDANLYLENDLFAFCNAVYEGDGCTLDAENITADNIYIFANGDCGGGCGGGGITNSILTSFFNNINCFVNNFTIDSTCVLAGDGAGIYQTVGDGNYYLANGSPYQGAGTTSIDPWLLADLQTKTTWPPQVYASTAIGSDTTLGIAAPRDSGTSGVDIGYHYCPLDYVFGGTTVNGNLTFANGVAVGWYNDGSGYGILMSDGMTANFQGNWWVRANTVQESGGSTVWPGAGWLDRMAGARFRRPKQI